MSFVDDFSTASRWGKLVLLLLAVAITLLGLGCFSMNWASGNAVETRDWNKNVMYTKNLSDIFDISSHTGLWEFCTKLTFKKTYKDNHNYFYREKLQKSVSGCRRINVDLVWLKAVQVCAGLSFPFAGLAILCILVYIWHPEKYRIDKTAIVAGIFCLMTCLLITISVGVFGIHLGSKGLELSQFDCYYLDNFVFAASDLSWSFLVTCLSGILFLAGCVTSYFLTLRTRQRERMRRRSENRSNANAPHLLTQSSQISDNVFT